MEAEDAQPDRCRWDAPVLIVGAPRSGTTLLTRVLSSHPELAITKEAHLLVFLRTTQCLAGLPINKLVDEGPMRLLGLVNPTYQERFTRLHLRHALAMLREFYREEFAGKPFTRFGDKIVFGAQSFPDLLATFPGLQFVHAVRDPRDAVLSMRLHGRRTARRYEHAEEHDLAALCRHWVELQQQIEVVLDEHNALRVRYEELIAEPEREVQRLLAFLGVPEHPATRRYLEEQGPAHFAGHGTSESPAQSVGRWRRELSADEVATAERICGAEMRRLGYASSADSSPKPPRRG